MSPRESSFGIRIDGSEIERIFLKNWEVIPEDGDDPELVVYTISPSEAAFLIVRIWSMLPLEFRPVPAILGQ